MHVIILEGNMDQDIDDMPARLNKAIENLPDDLIIHIYTKILKKYRLHEGKFIKLIDFEKYKFLENFVYRKMVSFYRVRFGDSDEYRMRCTLANFSRLPNRKSMLAEGAWPSVEDDLMDVDMTVNENTVTYDVHRYRLKKIEELNANHKPSIYHRGDYKDYDWEVIDYTYEI